MAELVVIGTATPAQVLNTATFSAGPYIGATGAIVNQGALNAVTGIYAAGYYLSVKVPRNNEFTSDVARSGLWASYDNSSNLTYAVDGYNSSYLATCTAFSYTGNSWSTLASDASGGRNGLISVYSAGMNLTYAIDGYTGSYVATNEAYSHNSNSWTAEAADSAGGRRFLGGAHDSSASLAYAIDGNNGASMALLTGYSFSANTWTALASDGFGPRYDIGATYNSALNVTYAYGGTASTGAVGALESYSSATNSWTAEASDSVARSSMGFSYHVELQLAVSATGTGPNGTSTIGNVESYSGASNTWTFEFDTPSQVDAPGCSYDAITHYIYLIDGIIGASTPLAWVYGLVL